MKNKYLLLTTLLICTIYFNVSAQVGGNQVYQNQSINYNRSPVETSSISSTDSTLTVTAKVLLNQEADYYLLTIGANQIGQTVVEANQRLNERIDNVVKKIKKLGINDDDLYLDFIAETKLYDHKITDKEVVEYFDGFSIRKNLMIKVDQLNQIDQIINACSEEEIYDIIKVDYVSRDLETINAQLLAEALKIVQHKKMVFEQNSSLAASGAYRLAAERFKIYYPKNLYKQYEEAHESSLVKNYYNSSFTKKETRKERTFYYDGMETESGVDKIIDAISPVVGIQYILELRVVYELE
jgi:uncharacterized protein YggE